MRTIDSGRPGTISEQASRLIASETTDHALMATTLYNAAYFAGFEDVAHTPHSYYIATELKRMELSGN